MPVLKIESRMFAIFGVFIVSFFCAALVAFAVEGPSNAPGNDLPGPQLQKDISSKLANDFMLPEHIE